MDEQIKILLIEDNLADARLIQLYLKEVYSNDIFFHRSENLEHGLAEIKEHDFDVIIVDLSLPDSWGIDTFIAVSRAAPEKPVLVLTGHEDEEIGINTVKLGAQEFLIKGKINSLMLKRAINYSLERYKLLKSLSEYSRKLEERTADLQKEKAKLAEAQKKASVGSWERNVSDDSFSCSEVLCRIYGVLEDDISMTYAQFIGFIHPGDRARVTEVINNAVREKNSFTLTHRIIRLDGAVRLVYMWGDVVSDSTGSELILQGTTQDITERKNKEELEELAMVATKSFNAVTIADKTGRIVWVNEGFTKLFGYTLDDVKGTYGEILRRGEKTGLSPGTDFYTTVLREKKPVSYESRNFSKDGKEYWLLTSMTPVLDEKGNVEKIISIDSDISRQKRAEQDLIIANKISEHSLNKGNKALEELNKAKQQLEASLKVKEQFLANMSHEIRTPMNAIIGFTGLLLKSDHSTENRQYLNAIKTSGENLLVIINDILDFTKLESGKITFESIRFSLHQLVGLVAELMLSKAIEKSIKLVTKIDENIPEYIIGDPTRLNQILINLVGNAIKFTNRGEVKIIVTKAGERDGFTELNFSVSDTGIGIPEESLPRIFESFTQAANDTTRKYGGTGLGLTITKQLIEQQGGAVWVKSRLNEGSEFSFRLAFEISALQTQGVAPAEKEIDKDVFPLEGIKVLLVEDNAFNQILASKILTNWKCEVEVAPNGKIAVERAAETLFDIILMDIQLPEMDGYEATRHIRSKLPAPKCNVPIMAMTAHALSDEQSKCYKAGMNDYISKPFDENRLQAKLLKMLTRKAKDKKYYRLRTSGESTVQQKITDLTYLRKVSRGDENFMQKMISVFINQTPDILKDFELYSKNNDWTSLKIVAHRVKPSAVFMGIKQLEDIISKIEDNLAGQLFTNQIPGLIKKMQRICKLAIIELKTEMQKLERQDFSHEI